MNDGLKNKAIAGAVWSSVQKFGLAFISFLSNIVLARLLTPDDYGCIGMLSIFLVVSNALVYGGFISALIQKKNTTEDDYSTVFVWNLLIALFLYLVLYVIAPYVSSYYNIEQLCPILRVQGVILILNGFNAIQTTLLRKNLRFNKLAKINLTSASISIIVAILLAFYGYGVWALVFQQITSSMLNCIFLWSSTTWKPSCRFSKQSFCDLFSYGSFLLLNDLLNNICDNIQGLLIGKRFSPSIMGYYSQAKRLEEVPTQSISQMVAQVTFPIYSKIQDDKDRLYRAVKGSLALMNFINFPLMFLLITIAKPLFIFLYTEKWMDSVPYFQILCVAGIVNCLQSVNYQVVSASGRSKELFYWNFIKRTAGLIFMLVGLQFGVKGLLWGMVLSFYLIYIVNAHLAYQTTGYSIIQQIKDSLPLFIMASISSMASIIVRFLVTDNTIMLFAQSIIYFVTYILLAKLTRRAELTELLTFIKRENDK